MRHVFQELLGRSLRELQPVRGISDEEICTVIKNGAGVTGERQGQEGEQGGRREVGGKGEGQEKESEGDGFLRELLRVCGRVTVCSR